VLSSIGILHEARSAFRGVTGVLHDLAWLTRNRGRPAPDGLPYPPPALCHLVAANYEPRHYFATGVQGAAFLHDFLERAGRMEGISEVLDFGCACGRITRHLKDVPGWRLHGTDLDPRLTGWTRRNLPFIHTGTIEPNARLGYGDESFDLICAVAVFGHLREERLDTCFRELTRVLRPNGLLMATFKGRDRLHELSPEQADDFMQGKAVTIEPECSGTHYCLAYHPETYVRGVLTGGMETLLFEPSGSPDTRQDAYLFRKTT
jgi:SAM-dependent methyltransferase